MAIQATFTAGMAAIFLEDFFLQAIFWLFVAVTLFQMAFGGVVVWAFYSGIPSVCQAGELDSAGLQKVGRGFLLTGLTTEKVVGLPWDT